MERQMTFIDSCRESLTLTRRFTSSTKFASFVEVQMYRHVFAYATW